MLVLVTRPREQAAATSALLAAMGHEALIDPVLEIRRLPLPPMSLADVAAIAITSANAAPALAGLPAGLPVFAVGAATAAAVRAVGCQGVHVAAGDGADLARLVCQALPSRAGVILHLAGRDVREGLEAGLVEAGYRYRTAAVYEAVPVPTMAPEVAAALAAMRIGAVLLYSPRSAELWARRIEGAGLGHALAGTLAACLSRAVAAPLARLPFRSVRIAESRDQNALLRCLEG
jgi:uroporphyrinogen-III synthase